MKRLSIQFIVSFIALFAITGCSYNIHTPQSGVICKSHGRAYVNHFVKISGSKNWGAYFTRDTLQYLLDDRSITGVSVFIGCEDTVHPLIMEVENAIVDTFKLKGPNKFYLSSRFVKHTCFNKQDQSCNSINNYTNQGSCMVSGAYFSKELIKMILDNKKFAGIVIYIGQDEKNNYPLIMEGTAYKPKPSDINISSTYSIVSRTYCPRACGSLKDGSTP